MADDVKVEESTKAKSQGPVESLPVEKPLSSSDAKEAADLHRQISDIITEHGGVESNVPHNHIYWKLLNQFRTLVNKKKV